VEAIMNRSLRSMLGAGIATSLAFALSSACSSPVSLGGFVPEADASPPSIASDASAPELDANAFAPRCAATECPAPYGTCSDDSFRCETNFDSDNDNCGACGVVCPNGPGTRSVFGAEWFCQSGECRMACAADTVKHTGDCNHDIADGCEVNLQCDPNNCGSCGTKCPAGLACIFGNCGCPAGRTTCGNTSCGAECIDLSQDDLNCGTCGNECPPSEDPTPPHMVLGCVASQCGKLKCESYHGDCNNNENDGCEAAFLEDPENCGMCGRACAPGQRCENAQCKCAPSETACVDDFGNPYCANLDTDRQACGACGHRCPFVDAPAKSVCRFGRCELECAPGHADCDGRADNGCETFVAADPRNCGGCGVQCDLSFGQPCVQGVCNTAPCPEGPPK
jgi:hypothetical protein